MWMTSPRSMKHALYIDYGICLSVITVSVWSWYWMSHVMTHVLALAAVASTNRSTSHAVKAFHLHAVADCLALTAMALVTMGILMNYNHWSWSWCRVVEAWIVVSVIVCETSCSTDNHHCCDSESLESSHNLLCFMSLVDSGLYLFCFLILQRS